MNKNLLRAKMYEAGTSVSDLCKKCNISKATFYRKISGVSEFTQHEIATCIELLHLDMDTTRRIFFM